MQHIKNDEFMKPIPTKTIQPAANYSVFHPRWIGVLVVAFGLAFLLATSGVQTYWNKERRLILAGEEIVAALKAYRDASPGTAKDFPLELGDVLRDPRMLADKGYLLALPVDPITLTQEWSVVRNKNNQVIGVHSLSTDAPTLFARLLSLRSGDKYSEGLALGHWRFVAE
jgi:hypothetical protein